MLKYIFNLSYIFIYMVDQTSPSLLYTSYRTSFKEMYFVVQKRTFPLPLFLSVLSSYVLSSP